MKIAGLLTVVIAVIMLYAQFGGNKSAYTLYELKVPTQDSLPLPEGWPPILDKKYPDLELIDQNSNFFKLSDLKGAVIILIPIAMNNMNSVAYENIQKYGSFRNMPSAQNIRPIAQQIKRFAPQIKLPDINLVFVHLLLFNDMGKEATIQNAQEWAEHFKLRADENHVVAVPAKRIPDYIAQEIIPGVQLIDKILFYVPIPQGQRPNKTLKKH